MYLTDCFIFLWKGIGFPSISSWQAESIGCKVSLSVDGSAPLHSDLLQFSPV